MTRLLFISFRCVGEDRKGREASQSSPSSIKRPNLPAFPLISDSDSDLRSDLGDDEDEEDSDHKISNTETIIHLLKGNLGTGILAMPDAIKNSGMIIGNLGEVTSYNTCDHE